METRDDAGRKDERGEDEDEEEASPLEGVKACCVESRVRKLDPFHLP